MLAYLVGSYHVFLLELIMYFGGKACFYDLSTLFMSAMFFCWAQSAVFVIPFAAAT